MPEQLTDAETGLSILPQGPWQKASNMKSLMKSYMLKFGSQVKAFYTGASEAWKQYSMDRQPDVLWHVEYRDGTGEENEFIIVERVQPSRARGNVHGEAALAPCTTVATSVEGPALAQEATLAENFVDMNDSLPMIYKAAKEGNSTELDKLSDSKRKTLAETLVCLADMLKTRTADHETEALAAAAPSHFGDLWSDDTNLTGMRATSLRTKR